MRTYDQKVNREYMEVAAKAVAAAARSAPHTTGSLDLVINILSPEEIETIQRQGCPRIYEAHSRRIVA